MNDTLQEYLSNENCKVRWMQEKESIVNFESSKGKIFWFGDIIINVINCHFIKVVLCVYKGSYTDVVFANTECRTILVSMQYANKFDRVNRG